MIRFNCDYNEGAHPRILEELVKTNMEQMVQRFFLKKAGKTGDFKKLSRHKWRILPKPSIV